MPGNNNNGKKNNKTDVRGKSSSVVDISSSAQELEELVKNTGKQVETLNTLLGNTSKILKDIVGDYTDVKDTSKKHRDIEKDVSGIYKDREEDFEILKKFYKNQEEYLRKTSEEKEKQYKTETEIAKINTKKYQEQYRESTRVTKALEDLKKAREDYSANSQKAVLELFGNNKNLYEQFQKDLGTQNVDINTARFDRDKVFAKDKITGEEKEVKLSNDVYTSIKSAIHEATKNNYKDIQKLSKDVGIDEKEILDGDYQNIIANSVKNEEEKRTQIFEKDSKSLKTELIKTVADLGKNIFDELTRVVNQSISSYNSAYESTFSQIAGRTGSGNNSTRGETREYYNQLVEKFDVLIDGTANAASISKEAIPMMADLASKGLQGDNLVESAFTATIDKKIMPWLDETSSEWITINKNLSDFQVKTLKGQQLVLQETESGNRLLQSGVIDHLINDMQPVLSNIDFNTGGANNLSTEYQAIMQTMVDNGYTENEAYAQVQNMMKADKNLYTALTSGDVVTRLYAQGKVEGKDTWDAMSQSYGTVSKMAGQADQVGAGAIYSVYGGGFTDWQTQDQGKRESRFFESGKDNYTKILKDLRDTDKAQDKYAEAKDNANKYVTAQQSFENAVDKFGAIVGRFETLFAGGSFLGGMARGVLSTVIGNKISDLGGELVKKIFTGGGSGSSMLQPLKNLGNLKELSNVGKLGDLVGKAGNIASKAGGIAQKAGSLAKSAGNFISSNPALGFVAGGLMMAKDAFDGVKKAQEWGVSKGKAGLTSAVLGDEERSLKRTGKQALKYGAIGSSIGTLIGGPVGTAIGGAIGAGVGAITSLVDTKKVAQWWQNKSDERKEKKEQKKEAKEEKKEQKKNGKHIYSDSLASIIKLLTSINNALGGESPNNEENAENETSKITGKSKLKSLGKSALFGVLGTGLLNNSGLSVLDGGPLGILGTGITGKNNPIGTLGGLTAKSGILNNEQENIMEKLVEAGFSKEEAFNKVTHKDIYGAIGTLGGLKTNPMLLNNPMIGIGGAIVSKLNDKDGTELKDGLLSERAKAEAEKKNEVVEAIEIATDRLISAMQDMYNSETEESKKISNKDKLLPALSKSIKERFSVNENDMINLYPNSISMSVTS